MLCSDVMLSYVYSCRPTDSVADCARLMQVGKIGFVPVLDQKSRPVGVVTDRDLALRVLATGLPPDTDVAMVMSKAPLLTCRPDEDLSEVEKRMAEAKKSRAIVVDGAGRCLGVISLADIAQREPSERAGVLLQEITRREASLLVKQ